MVSEGVNVGQIHKSQYPDRAALRIVLEKIIEGREEKEGGKVEFRHGVLGDLLMMSSK